jgi:hypothetical protein
LQNVIVSSPDWWNSLNRVDAIFRLSRNVALTGFVIAAFAWAARLFVVAVPATVIAAAGILFALFTWFRRDDLSSHRPR